jgi:hypothetical protein
MPDTIIPPPQPTSNFYIPDSGMPKVTSPLDDWKNDQDLSQLPLGGDDYGKSISFGESITDLINDVEKLQNEGEVLLNQNNSRGGVPNYPGGYNPNSAYDNLYKDLTSGQSLQSFAKPVIVGTESQFDRYKGSKDFQTFGYNAALGDEQEYKYGRAMTWGDTMGKALGGGAHLAADTFVEGWKGWGRMASALFTWDSSKLMGSEEERYQMAKEQEAVMNKYAIYDTEASKDSIWNRQFFGTMLQQSGFAVGAALQFATEQFLTAGIGGAISAASKGMLVARVGKAIKTAAEIRTAAGLAEKSTIIGRTAEKVRVLFRPKSIETAADLTNASRKVMNTVTQQPKVVNALVEGLKKLTPGYGTVDELVKLHKAGAGFAQLAFTGVGGIKRGLSEFNMARSESIFEAAGTYKQLEDRLVNDYYEKNGEYPQGQALEKIKQSAEDASHDNFMVNMGVLSVMNRIQFDNMFKGFSKSRSLLSEGASSLKGKAISVTAKNLEGAVETKVFKKGLFGGFSTVGQVAKVFGKKEAAWVATKSIGKGLMKFEGSEGMQELIQGASGVGLEQYYYDLYHGKKGYTGRMDAMMSNMQNPLTSMEGMKTFLMGALTGRIIAIPSGAFTGIATKIGDSNKIKAQAAASKNLLNSEITAYTEKYKKAPEGKDLEEIQTKVAATVPEYQTTKQKVDESINLLNTLYQDPTWLKNEAIANIKVNNLAAETMDVAAANHNKYIFNNSKDSALAKTIAAAIKLDMYDSLRDVIKEYGKNMTDVEFKQAFGIEASKDNKKNVESLTKTVVENIEDYYDTFKILTDKYQDVIIPELYKNNKPQDYANAVRQKNAVNNVIEMIATNSFKAKTVIKRASQLQTEMSANKNIGASSMEVLTKLGNDQALQDHIRMLNLEILLYKLSDVPTTPEQKEVYKDKVEELQLAEAWLSHKDEIMENTSAEYSPTAEGRAYDTFSKLINLFNKRAKNTTVVSKEDIDDNFIKLTDYIKLNKDHGEYVDAMNLLADPRNMKIVAQSESSAMAYRIKFYNEQKKEIAEATGIEDEPDTYAWRKEEDGTYTVYSVNSNTEVFTGLATEEEAIEKVAKLNEELAILKTEEELKAKKEDIEKRKQEELTALEEKYKDNYNQEYNDAVEEINQRYEKELADLEEQVDDKIVRPELLELFEKIKDIITREDLTEFQSNLPELILDMFTENPMTIHEQLMFRKVLDDKETEISKFENPIKKSLLDTDPEFVKEFNAALIEIEKVINNPDVTVQQIEDIFSLLKSPITKLEKTLKQQYVNKYQIIKKDEIEKAKYRIASKDIEGVKKLITKNLEDDTITIASTVDELFMRLNLVLNPEFKDEAIEHFEKEYLKAIDRKIAKLLSEVNNGSNNPLLEELIDIKKEFKKEIELKLENFKTKSAELAKERDKMGTFIVPYDQVFSTPINTSIQASDYEGDSSFSQQQVLINFTEGGLLSEKEVERGFSETRKGASKLINLGISRIYTIQLNMAVDILRTKNDSSKLKEILFRYLKDKTPKDSQTNKPVEDSVIKKLTELTVDSYDPEDNQTSAEILEMINTTVRSAIPVLDYLDNDKYELFEQYRKTIFKIIEDNEVLDILNISDRIQQNLVLNNNKEIKDIFPDELLKKLNIFLENKSFANVKEFQKDVLDNYEKIKQATTYKDVKSILLDLASKYFYKSKNVTGFKVLESLYINALQIESLISSEEGIFEPLSDMEMIDALENPKSLNKDQISQIETFAKTQQLEKHKQKLRAAIGNKGGTSNFVPELKSDTIVSNFNSLRPKFADDTRTTEDLTNWLSVNENGEVNFKLALAYIAYSYYATDAEKALAKKFMEIVSDDEVIKIDNTLPELGAFIPETNQIILNLNYIGFKKNEPSAAFEPVLLHELIHGLTEKALEDKNSDYYKKIKDVFDVIKKQEGASTFYAFKDGLEEDDQIHEFVAEAFTNPAFQYLLAKTPYKNTTTTMWDEFIKILSGILSAIGVTLNETALSEVLSLTDSIIDKPVEGKEQSFPSEKVMEDIKNAKTENKINSIREELKLNKDKYLPDTYNALAAALNRKLISINAPTIQKDLTDKKIKIKNELSSYTLINIDGKSYYYTIKNNKLTVVKIGNYKLNNVKSQAILEKIVKTLISKNNLVDLISKDELKLIKYIGGGRQTEKSYASGTMIDDYTTSLAESKYQEILQGEFVISFKIGDGSLKDYKEFKKAFAKYKATKDSTLWEKLTEKYGKTVVQDFGELYDVFGRKSGRKQFADMDALVKAKILDLSGRNGASIQDITYDGIDKDLLMQLYQDIIDKVDLDESEYMGLQKHINKMLSNFLGITVSIPLQKTIEDQIFGDGSDENTDDVDTGGGENILMTYDILLDRAALKFRYDHDNKGLSYLFFDVLTDAIKTKQIKTKKELDVILSDWSKQSMFNNNPNKISASQQKILDNLTSSWKTDESDDDVFTLGNFTIISDLSTADYEDDNESVEFTKVFGKSLSAAEPNALRSKGNDGIIKNNTFVENEEFANNYHKVREIINILSTKTPDEIDNFYVTIDKDSSELRWDGSKATDKVIGYVSDAQGNPIIFNKDGVIVDKLDKKNLSNEKGFNTGENQIIYFNIPRPDNSEVSLKELEQESLSKVFNAIKEVENGKPQIAKVQKISKGIMSALNGKVKVNGKNQLNTARDEKFRNTLNQDHVSLQIAPNGNFQAIITDAVGGTNITVLFPPSSRAVKVQSSEGTFVLFDYIIELMKIYHQMEKDGYKNIGDIGAELKTFVNNIWLTGPNHSLQIHKSFKNITIQTKNPNTNLLEPFLFTVLKEENGEMLPIEENIKKIRKHVNNLKINVYKGWLEKRIPFKFPFIAIDKNGKKVLQFEEKDYKDFLIKEVGLISYIGEIPEQENIKRYNTSIHFSEPHEITEDKPSDVIVTSENIISDPEAVEKAVDAAVEKVVPTSGKVIPNIKKKRYVTSPAFIKPYEKICR